MDELVPARHLALRCRDPIPLQSSLCDPDDFWRIANFFPYIEALVWRREFYGV
jgi:hypothetical protein